MAAEDGWRVFRGKRVGLLTNPSGVMPGTLEHAVDVMLADGVDLRAVFGPEHGFRGIAQAGASTHPSLSSTAPSKIATTTTTTSPDDPSAPAFFDPRSGLPVFDVYRKSGADLVSVFRRADVDVIAFDMQDVGARFTRTFGRCTTCSSPRPPPIRRCASSSSIARIRLAGTSWRARRWWRTGARVSSLANRWRFATA